MITKPPFMMKCTLFFLICAFIAQGQNKSPIENVVFTSQKKKTQAYTNEKGELVVNVAPKEVIKYKTTDG
ncbi:MAG: hypothetical protein R2822_08335 [Spirosomataceae bacterium]